MTSKEFVYRVSDANGNYIGVWPDVVSELTWSQPINSPGTTTVVRLGRSANNTIELRDALVTDAGVAYVSDDGVTPYVTVSETPNVIGAGTDVEMNYNVDIYVVYGNYDELVTNTGEQYVSDDGVTDYIVADGAPLGKRVFSGLITDYEASYGDQEYVDVTIASNGFELSNEIVKSGTATTVAYTGVAPEAIIKNILDTNPGKMTYSTSSLQATGLSINLLCQLNTKLEGIQNVYNQTNNSWYWFGNPADNCVYMFGANSTADHVFQKGLHINNVKIKRSMETLKNTVYFVGGNPGSGVLYKKFVDSTDLTAWRQGIERITDTRYTASGDASRYASKVMGHYGAPIYTTTVSIPSEVYDIETISLGQLVGFKNFGNFVDNVLLYIVNIDYTPHLITLQLGDLLDRVQDITTQIDTSLQNTQYSNIPTVPS